MNMGVSLNNIGIATLITDGVEGLSFPNHVDFVAGALHEGAALHVKGTAGMSIPLVCGVGVPKKGNDQD